MDGPVCRYRVRGFSKNLSYDLMKVNLLASHGDGFHVDTLNLYTAHQRTAFIKQAAVEMGVKEEVIRHDLGQVLLKLEELQDQQIQKTLEPKKPEVAISDEDRTAALDLLNDPRLLERMLADFTRCGVVGEETNKKVAYLAAVSRLLDTPLAIIIQSSSAAGKSSLMIRQGKGRKDRVIPIGERALAWIDKYLRESRPQLLTGGSDDGTVFLTYLGQPFDRRQLTALVRGYLIESKVGKMGGCHLFRHTVATLMLENGADIRVIQQMLGHVKLTTTELYTRVSINLLRQVYSATHPAAHLNRPETSAAPTRDPQAEAELFDALAAESEEDSEDE